MSGRKPENAPEPELLTAAQAGAKLGLRRERVYALARRGLLPPGVIVRFGRQVRVHRDRLEKFLQSGGASYPDAESQ